MKQDAFSLRGRETVIFGFRKWRRFAIIMPRKIA